MSIDTLPETKPAETSPDRRDSEPALESDGRRRPPRRKWWKGLLLLLVLGGLGATAAAVLPQLMSAAEDDPRLTHFISRGDLVVSVVEQGTLESSSNVEIKCKIRGFSTVTSVIDGGMIVEPGDELVRLDTKVIEEQLSLTKTNTFEAKSTLERTRANAEQAEIAIDAYLKGRYRSQMQGLKKQRDIAKRNLETAKKMHAYSDNLFQQGYVTELEVEGNAFTVEQAELELEVTVTQIKVLEDFTRKMQIATLEGNLKAAQTKLKSDEAALKTELSRQKRAEQELKDCVITADRGGLVIYPSAAAWKETPDVSQGASVRKDQVLLLMPDLTQMQVKVGIHESIVDRIRPGLKAIVSLPEMRLEAEVTTVASVTRPAGWWTGNVVKYDTIIKLPSSEGLKPGMSAEVEVVMARHEDVVIIPVAAVVETNDADYCWVKTKDGTKRRLLQLGDTNDVSIVVKDGVKEGDEVILNPLAYIKEAQDEALKTIDESPNSEL